MGSSGEKFGVRLVLIVFVPRFFFVAVPKRFQWVESAVAHLAEPPMTADSAWAHISQARVGHSRAIPTRWEEHLEIAHDGHENDDLRGC